MIRKLLGILVKWCQAGEVVEKEREKKMEIEIANRGNEARWN